MRRLVERRGRAEVWAELGHGWTTYRAVWWTPAGALWSAPSRRDAAAAWSDVPAPASREPEGS